MLRLETGISEDRPTYLHEGVGNINSVGPEEPTYNALDLPATGNNGMAWDYAADGCKIRWQRCEN